MRPRPSGCANKRVPLRSAAVQRLPNSPVDQHFQGNPTAFGRGTRLLKQIGIDGNSNWCWSYGQLDLLSNVPSLFAVLGQLVGIPELADLPGRAPLRDRASLAARLTQISVHTLSARVGSCP